MSDAKPSERDVEKFTTPAESAFARGLIFELEGEIDRMKKLIKQKTRLRDWIERGFDEPESEDA